MHKTILQWTSKVQYKKGTPFISMIRHLSQHLYKGTEIECKLVMVEGKLRVVVELE